jgi:hypothetical protein
MKVTRELLQQLPKTDLHVHLDGSLRPRTLIELAKEYERDLPRSEAEALRDFMHVTDARNLVDYLARFDITLSVMQTMEALERIAYELAEDAAAGRPAASRGRAGHSDRHHHLRHPQHEPGHVHGPRRSDPGLQEPWRGRFRFGRRRVR